MDGLLLLLTGTTMLALFGLAAQLGVDTRDSYGDDHAARPRH